MKRAAPIAIFLLALLHPVLSGERKHISSNENNYEVSVEIELLDEEVVPSWRTINSKLPELILADGCDAKEEDRLPVGYYMEANAQVEATSSKYVSYRIWYSVYCGGAHPSHWLDFKTFKASTGDAVKVAADIPIQDYDDPSYDYEKIELHQLELARIMLKHLDPDNEVYETCPEEVSSAQAIADSMYPSISGLGPAGQVIINTSPAHVIAVCRFDVSVPFDAVQQFFSSQSKVRTILGKPGGG